MMNSIQKKYLKHWLILCLVGEAVLFTFIKYLYLIYAIIGILFTGGFILRVFKIYPGKEEPLILDFAGAIVSFLFAGISKFTGDKYLYFLILSPLIILPHIFYILFNPQKL